MPSARMQSDGAFTAGATTADTLNVFSVNYQALPWVETSFRYTIFNPGQSLGSRDVLSDRSFSIKARLLRETKWRPAVALGVQDLIGTGVLSGEYLVASKRIGPFDVTAGLGTGRFATRDAFDNPLGVISERFEEREGFREGEQGQLLGNTYFRGRNVGAFGGIEYEIPRFNVVLKAEYSSDSYEREIQIGTLSESSPWNAGISWRPAPNLEIGISRQLGKDWVLRFSSQLDTKSTTPRKRRQPFWAASEPRELTNIPEGTDHWYRRLLLDVNRSGVLLLHATPSDDRNSIWLEIENAEYTYAADAIERVLALAEVHLPSSYRTINVILNSDGIRHGAISYARSTSRGGTSARQDFRAIRIIEPRPLENIRYRTKYILPNVGFTADLAGRYQVMDPDDPFRYQIFARLGAAVDLGHDFYVHAIGRLDIYNDFGDITRQSDSVLPRVRSAVRRYLQEGESGIASLYIERRQSPFPDVHYRAYAGILEDMFSGVGAEVLWRPYQSRFAVGGNLNYARQRDFDSRFSHLDYDIVTGHVSLYWATPVANFDAAIHAGRYLAGDRGATFEVRRTFTNGWMIGAFATFTNVPFDRFGEGSFDKGLIFKIPFNPFIGSNSRTSFSNITRLTQRDGGQRLNGFGDTLWWDLRATRTDALIETRERMLPR